MNLTVFQILLSLLNGAGSASEILEAIRRFDGDERAPSLASFYRNLKRAMDEGWLEVAGEDEQTGPGRPRQRYSITAAGRSAVKLEAERLSRLAERADSGYALPNPRRES